MTAPGVERSTGRRAPAGARGRGALALLGLLWLGSGCAALRDAFAPAPVGRPSGRVGWLAYELGDLSFEAPADWRASGGERRMKLAAADGRAQVEISYPATPYPDERACLAAAEEKLREQAGRLERARRHPTRLGGAPAHALEGDQGGWHVWAYAACEGGVQYRVFFTAASPASPEHVEAQRTLVSSARIGGEA